MSCSMQVQVLRALQHCYSLFRTDATLNVHPCIWWC
jgi:hypothetical protein